MSCIVPFPLATQEKKSVKKKLCPILGIMAIENIVTQNPLTENIMDFQNLKTGDKIEHYCCGLKVTGTVVETTKYHLVSQHKPVTWGNQIFTKTFISPPQQLHRMAFGAMVVPTTTYKGQIVKYTNRNLNHE